MKKTSHAATLFNRARSLRRRALLRAQFPLSRSLVACRKAIAGSPGNGQLHVSQLQPRAVDRLHEATQPDRAECKDTKDHLPMDPAEEAKALADYAAAGIKLHAAGTIYFQKDEDADIRSKFEYCKRAGISVIVAGDPTPRSCPALRSS
jgi:hypothetical protein